MISSVFVYVNLSFLIEAGATTNEWCSGERTPEHHSRSGGTSTPASPHHFYAVLAGPTSLANCSGFHMTVF